MTSPSWSDDALCTTRNPETFYPAARDRYGARDAVRVCVACPVIEQCLAYAMTFEARVADGTRHGVWGGLIPAQRASLARRHRMAGAA